MASIDAEACSYCGVEDEEPPSTTVQLLSPRRVARFSRPKRPRAIAQGDIFSPGAPPGRTPRSTFQTRAFRRSFYPDVPDRDWNDWRWQARNRLRTLDQLEQVLVLSDEERAALAALSQRGAMLPVSITPYYMSLVSRDDQNQPLRRTVIPTTAEFEHGLGEADDPLGEDGDSPVPGLVHRYPDRVLLLVTDFCSSYCRYCTRSRMVGHGAIAPSEARLEQAFDYIRRTPAVRDVLISGGDPLALSDERLDWILSRLRAIPHVEFLRMGTKMPAVLPQRITPRALPDASQVPSPVDEPALPPSRRVHARVVPGLHAAGRRRNTAWARRRCCWRASTTTSRR